METLFFKAATLNAPSQQVMISLEEVRESGFMLIVTVY